MEYNVNRPNFPLRYRTDKFAAKTLPFAPRNVNVTSPYLIGVIDIRWDDPSQYAENNETDVLGVNVYRSFDSPEGPYEKLNDNPIGALYYRDETTETYVDQEDPTVGGRFIPGTTATGDWIAKTYHRPIIIPGTNGEIANNHTHVRVDIRETSSDDFVTVPAFKVVGEPGEIYLISKPVYNHTTNRCDPPVLPDFSRGGEIRISYTYLSNHIQTNIYRKAYYKVSTVAFDNSCEGGTKETPLNEVEAFSLYDMEKIDWIWAEAIRRNRWILFQGGERVKVFIRKWNGQRCPCWDDEYRQAKEDCHVCFPPGTEVTMEDLTRRPIEDIKVGDKVLTHKGRAREVSLLMKRAVDEDIVSIKSIHGIELRPTKNHPLLVLRKADAKCYRMKRMNCTGAGSKPICNSGSWKRSCCSNPVDKLQWIRAEDVREGDYLVSPASMIEEEHRFTKDELKILGYYAAEGWTAKRDKKSGGMTDEDKRVLFGFHEEEVNTVVADLKKSVEAVGHSMCVTSRPSIHRGITATVSSVDLCEMVLDNVGKYSKGKRLSRKLVNQNPSDVLTFLGAYFNGDGWQSSNSKNTSIGSSSASYQLSRQLQGMLLRDGIVANFITRTRTLSNPGRPGNHVSTSNSLKIGKNGMNKLAKHTVYKEMPTKRSGQYFFVDRYAFYPIKKVSHERYRGEVYNLEVAEDNSYVAEGVAVHNCYGTGYIGGYEGPYSLLVAPPETEKTVNLFDVGLHVSYDWMTWTGPYPLLTDRDFVVRQNNERFSVARVNPQGQRGAIFQQHFMLAPLDHKDIRYYVPISGGATVPPEWDRYRKDQPTEASPEMPNKPEIPDQYEYRGRTVTFENIVY